MPLACDAFSSEAVAALLEAKGRGRDMPVPVLVGSPRVLDGLASGVTQRVRDLVVEHTQGRMAGLLGEPRVNVLALNLALDEASK